MSEVQDVTLRVLDKLETVLVDISGILQGVAHEIHLIKEALGEDDE